MRDLEAKLAALRLLRGVGVAADGAAAAAAAGAAGLAAELVRLFGGMLGDWVGRAGGIGVDGGRRR